MVVNDSNDDQQSKSCGQPESPPVEVNTEQEAKARYLEHSKRYDDNWHKTPRRAAEYVAAVHAQVIDPQASVRVRRALNASIAAGLPRIIDKWRQYGMTNMEYWQIKAHGTLGPIAFVKLCNCEQLDPGPDALIDAAALKYKNVEPDDDDAHSEKSDDEKKIR
jgi:hypothetical protein